MNQLSDLLKESLSSCTVFDFFRIWLGAMPHCFLNATEKDEGDEYPALKAISLMDRSVVFKREIASWICTFVANWKSPIPDISLKPFFNLYSLTPNLIAWWLVFHRLGGILQKNNYHITYWSTMWPTVIITSVSIPAPGDIHTMDGGQSIRRDLG